MITEILNYTLIRKIGEGGMGQVFLAKNKSIHQFVAIKMLNPRYSDNPVVRDRFRQEAIMLSSLDHPNIVKFLNYVENEYGIFLIMEFVDGMTLEDYLNKKTGLIVEEKAFPMMQQILDAFAYAHDRNVVHRDIKPSNIFVTKEGNIKILDFGIAQIMSDANARTDSYGGTQEYMSPEQIMNRPVDTRSDIYSLGVVFHQMLTGRPPYDAASMTDLEIKKDIVSRPLPRMKEIYPYISDETQSLVDRATCKSPDERYHDCHEMKQTLDRISSPDNINVYNSGRKGLSSGWIVAGLVLLLAIVGLGIWGVLYYTGNANRHYADFIEVNGIPEGIGTEAKTNGAISYLIENSGGRPVRVTLVDAKGNPGQVQDSILAHYKPEVTEYVYRDNGRLDHKTIYDKDGNRLYTVAYNEDFSDATVMRANDTVRTRYNLVRDDVTGRLKEIRYVNNSGDKKALKGAYGEAYTYDNSGRLTRVTFLDSDYKPAENENGIAIINFNYGESLADATSSFYDKNGHETVPKAPAPAKTPKKKRHKNKTEVVEKPEPQSPRNQLPARFGKPVKRNNENY